MESDSETLESRLEETNGVYEQSTDITEADEYLNSRELLEYSSKDIKPSPEKGKNKNSKVIKTSTENIENKIRESVLGSKDYASRESQKNLISDIIAVESAAYDECDEEDNNKGAAVIIYNKGTGEFYLELKPDTHPIVPGKLALVGGSVEPTDASSLDALIREIREEVVNKKAQEILISKLTQLGTYYYTIVDIVDGRKIETDIYLINIESDEKWEVVKNSPLTEGIKQVLTHHEISNRLNDFAFKYEEPLIKLINEEYNMRSRRAKRLSNYALPINSSIVYSVPTYKSVHFPSIPSNGSNIYDWQHRNCFKKPNLSTTFIYL